LSPKGWPTSPATALIIQPGADEEVLFAPRT
jgi:hypothetical protein